jgi:acyl dehydratase
MTQIDLSPGAELPALIRQTGFAHWNRYAAVNDEFVPIHMDDAAGREAGFATAIGMGNLTWAYFHRLLRDWMGEAGRIETIGARYSQPNLRDSTLILRARIAEAADAGEGGVRARLELTAEDDGGRTIATGQATVLVRRPPA